MGCKYCWLHPAVVSRLLVLRHGRGAAAAPGILLLDKMGGCCHAEALYCRGMGAAGACQRAARTDGSELLQAGYFWHPEGFACNCHDLNVSCCCVVWGSEAYWLALLPKMRQRASR